jgi:hypothetical protein
VPRFVSIPILKSTTVQSFAHPLHVPGSVLDSHMPTFHPGATSSREPDVPERPQKSYTPRQAAGCGKLLARFRTGLQQSYGWILMPKLRHKVFPPKCGISGAAGSQMTRLCVARAAKRLG